MSKEITLLNTCFYTDATDTLTVTLFQYCVKYNQ